LYCDVSLFDNLSTLIVLFLKHISSSDAENPLAPAPRRTKKGGDGKSGDEPTDGIQDYFDSDSEADDDDEDQLGHYETEQLINAITKITDLLRKCWGVAGAGIISSNLARTEGGKTAVFNPCVPGRLVYALFGFVGINDFSQHLRNLDQDVMILINDVARVVHGEVYRWGYGGSGQCNKNLGSCFLMVFRIGDSQTVQKRKEMATEVIFSSMRKRSSTTKHRLKKIKPGSGKRYYTLLCIPLYKFAFKPHLFILFFLFSRWTEQGCLAPQEDCAASSQNERTHV